MANTDQASLFKRGVYGIQRRIHVRIHRLLNGMKAVRAWIVIVVIGTVDRIRLAQLSKACRVLHKTATRPTATTDNHGRIAFVLPWFGKDIGGGAEAEARGLIQALNKQHPDIEIEVLSTTLKEFAADWNTPFHAPGCSEEDGIVVRRFAATTPDRRHFHYLNGNYLMQNSGPCPQDPKRSPVPRAAECYFLRRTIRSDSLLRYMKTHYDEYDAFVLIPYMFALTVEGCLLAGKKAMLIPCLHDERYAYMHVYRKAFATIGAALCHVRSEAALFARLYPQAPAPSLIGEQVDVEVSTGNAERFREKYGIKGPFILYAGRQVEGKNLPLMVEYFERFCEAEPTWEDLQFILIGKGDLDYEDKPNIRSLGFVSAQDKIDAYRAANAFVMLSNNESFSIVIMEAWLQQTPIIVSSQCAVTTDHVKDSEGGVAVDSADAFRNALVSFLRDPSEAARCGQRGREYVLAHFTPEIVTGRFREELNRVVDCTGR
jgi:glycosyltransferase involved in cell wall biosynthesis